ncbi:MAG: lipopolysaccharide biosynthesis protein [Anaerolineales bacterium]|nr:lipopolysaccharide biosynthesis protein [Anaerolineales bacterium]
MIRLVLLRILESYFRHRWIYLLPPILLVFAGVSYLLLQEPAFLAKGVLFVQQESFIAQLTSVRDVGFTWNSPAQEVATEFTDLMKTDAFARAIIQKTNLESSMSNGPEVVQDILDEVRKDVWAVPQGQNQVLFNASYTDPEVTSQLVSASINNFIEWKTNSERVDSETALEFFQDLSNTYQEEYDAAREALVNYLIAHPEPLRGNRPDQEQLEIDQLQSDLQTVEARYSRALDNVENARLSLAQIESNANQTYILIDAPVTPDKPEISRKSMAITLAIFGVVGVLLSLIGIGSSTLVNRSFMFPVDVVNLTGLPVLSSFPVSPKSKKQGKRLRISATNASKVAPSSDTPPAENAEKDGLAKQKFENNVAQTN